MGYSPWGHKRVGHDLAAKQQHSGLGLAYLTTERDIGAVNSYPDLAHQWAMHSKCQLICWCFSSFWMACVWSGNSHRVGHDWSDLAAAAAARIMRADFKMAPEEPKWSWKDGWINTQWSSIWWNIIQSWNRRKFWHTPQHEWTLKNYAEWNKSDTKGQLLYDSTSVRYTE